MEENQEKKIKLSEVVQAVKKGKMGIEDTEIVKYINMFEADVQMNVLHKKADELETYDIKQDQNKELIIPFPFYDAYELYCETMINYKNKEFTLYNQTKEMFDAKYNSYKNYIANKDYDLNGYMKYIQ